LERLGELGSALAMSLYHLYQGNAPRKPLNLQKRGEVARFPPSAKRLHAVMKMMMDLRLRRRC
jgi:hypothetical protein